MDAILQVAVDVPVRSLYDYLPPAGPLPVPGTRVTVPFGRRPRVGLVVAHAPASAVPAARLRQAVAVLDDAPLLPPALIELLFTAARYYHHPAGEVFMGALPAPLRRGAPARTRAAVLRLAAAGVALDPATLGRAPRQAALLAALRARPDGIPIETLRRELPGHAGALRALRARGLVEAAAAPPTPAGALENPPGLNADQAAAVAAVSTALGSYAPFVLDGVTGSGKTEVYLRLVEAVAERGLQTLLLVPEISLTPQTVERLRRRLAMPVAVLHSGLADGERLDAWLGARDGSAGVVLGTRSALFTPLARPGLIVVDEEHDPSYKQQEGLRYSARDLAVLRARLESVPVVLGSATPALETLAQVRRGRYRSLALPARAAGGAPPPIEFVDLRRAAMHGPLSATLAEAVGETLAAGGQALLFLNRRGYAPVLLCHACGAVPACPRCDARLTLHLARRLLLCHHCGHQRPRPAACADCGAADLLPVGAGTERVEAVLEALFPQAPVMRLDRDSVAGRGTLAQQLDAVQSGAARLLVGTQMLAKGHHFPQVALAAVVDADGGLYAADFRAPERLAQLIAQVAGRCGRGAQPGRVLVQTHHPQHPLLVTLRAGGYAAVADVLLAERQAAGLPPYAHLALLRAQAPVPQAPQRFLSAARACLEHAPGIELLGPLPAPMPRKAGLHRAQLVLQAAQRTALHRALDAALPVIERIPAARRVRWSLDVDPADTY